MIGDILFIKSSGWVGKRIRRLTNCLFNHVAIFIDNENVIEATILGVKRTSFTKYYNKFEKGKIDYCIGRVTNLTREQRITCAKYCEQQLGEGYDFLQLISLGFLLLFGKSRKVEPLDLRNTWICSELITQAYAKQGFIFNPKVDIDTHTPADIYYSDNVLILDK